MLKECDPWKGDSLSKPEANKKRAKPAQDALEILLVLLFLVLWPYTANTSCSCSKRSARTTQTGFNFQRSASSTDVNERADFVTKRRATSDERQTECCSSVASLGSRARQSESTRGDHVRRGQRLRGETETRATLPASQARAGSSEESGQVCVRVCVCVREREEEMERQSIIIYM